LQGIKCKALSLGNGKFSGETLSVSSQDLKKNTSTSSHRIESVTATLDRLSKENAEKDA